MEEESMHRSAGIDFAKLQRSDKFLEKVKEFQKYFEEIQQSINFNREHFTVLLECMEYHEQIGTAKYTEMVAGIMEIACHLVPKGDFKFRLFDELKDRFIKVVVSVMNTYQHQAMVQKQGVNIFSLLLHSGTGIQVLGDHTFNVAKVIVQSLDVINEEESESKVVKMMAICFPRENSREENALLGSRANIKNFLRILERKLQSHSSKPELSYIVGVLTSLTVSTPVPSINIVKENGLDLFERLVQDKDVDIEVKISALIMVGNMAEFSYAQKEIIKHKAIIAILLLLLVSPNIRASFIAAEALAQLSVVSEKEWTQLIGVSGFREKMLQKLYDQILKWESVTVPMSIRVWSFKHLYHLLQNFDSPATQLHAAWAIRYYCLENGKRYKEILIKDEGFDILTSIKDNDLTDSNVKKILHDIFLIARGQMNTGDQQRNLPLGHAADPNKSVASYTRKEKVNEMPNDVFANLESSYRAPENVKEFVKLFKEIQKNVDSNHEHFIVILKCMEYYEQIGNTELGEIITDLTEIVYVLLQKAGSKILRYEGLKDRLIKDIIAVMNTFKHQAPLQKHGVNIFALFAPATIFDHILSVAEAVMQSLDVLHEEDYVSKVAQMVTNFARELSREENAVLGSRANMKKFLRILEQLLQSHSDKLVLGSIIVALSCLTDDTPTSSINLVDENSLDLFERLLQDKDIDIEVKVDTLLLVGNMAEVAYTLKEIIKHKTIIAVLLFFLVSTNMRMSFISAEALAQLSVVSEAEWTQLIGVSGFREKMLQKLYDQIMKWESATVPMNIRVRTFKHLYRLLRKFDTPATQLYAAWTIRYYCLEDGKRYKEILIKEEGFDILTSIRDDDQTDPNAKKILHDIILIAR